jgi:hypothetical protein
MSCDELAPMPKGIPTDISKRKDMILEVMDLRMFQRETVESTRHSFKIYRYVEIKNSTTVVTEKPLAFTSFSC